MKLLTTLLELAGLIAIAVGVGMIYLPAGVIAAGALAIVASYFMLQAKKGRVR